MEHTASDLETAKAKLANVELTEAESSALSEWLDGDEVSGFTAGAPQGLFSLFGTIYAKAPGRSGGEIHDIEMEKVGGNNVIERTPYD